MQRKKIEHLIEIKQGLADKYQRRAKYAKSRPRRENYEHRADRYRWQVSSLKQLLSA